MLGGTLCMINHPSIDGIDGWLNSTGTTQRPSDFETSEVSFLTGRVLGSIIAVTGAAIVINEIV